MLKKGNPRANGASTNGKQSNQAGVLEKAVGEPYDILSVNPGRDKGRFSVLGYLTRGAHTTCAQRKSGLAYNSLLKEAQLQDSWCHAPLPKKRENGATRVGDVYTRGKYPTHTR